MNARESGRLEVGGRSRLSVGASVTLFSRSGRVGELTGNAAVLLAWVALEGHADRCRVSATLWPESDAAQARSNLRVLTHRINQRFGGELLVGAEHLALDASQAQVELQDAELVLAALAAGGAARCELLSEAGLGADAGEDLQAWLAGARQRQKRVQLARLDEALAQALAVASHDRAVALARACVQLDPLCEQRHRRLMEVLTRGGDRAAALAAYEECKAMLRQHLGVLPGLETRTVQLRILQEQALGPAFEPPHGGQQTPEADGVTTLGGAARYPLVEREAVLGQARAALQQGVHVVVQGEPGVGKTRLLRHLAAWAGGEVEPVAIRAALKQEPYAAVAQLLQEVQPRRAPCIGVPEQIELARLAPLAFAGVKPSEAALSAPRLHAALRHWVARLGDAGVRVLLLDDLQHADAASQAALASLLQALPEAADRAPALLLGHRSGEIDALLDDAVTDAQTRHRAQRIELPRLTQQGVQTLLGSMHEAQHTSEPTALAAQLHQRTGGNPLFVIELAQQTLEHGEAADTANLQALLSSRLAGCGAAAQQLAAVAAVAADAFTVELAAAVTGQTALALMPAWRALQQRGLFAGHGLAHELVRDAVLSEMPQAILQLLHRQVAQVLEAQGVQGAAVLRHWLAAQDADRALPHAVHQLYAVHAAGLPTAPQEIEVLGLLERTSDAVLMNNLWLTAEIAGNLNHDFMAAEVWSRLRALRQRVERLPEQGASAAWIAFEIARQRGFVDRSFEGAHEVLAPVAGRMSPFGLERAYVEYALLGCVIQLRGDPRVHVHRAQVALTNLPQQPSLKRVRKTIDTVAAIFLDPVEGLRAQAARWRAGRQRGDMALAADASDVMAHIHGGLGSHARAFRHCCLAARAHPCGGGDTEAFRDRFVAGVVALNSGHYEISQRLLTASQDSAFREKLPVLMAVFSLRLGDTRQAAMRARVIESTHMGHEFSVHLVHAHVCAELDQLEGCDPVPALRQRLEHMRTLGTGGVYLELMSWQILLRTCMAGERLGAGEALLAALLRSPSPDLWHIPLLLDVAEARAETNAAGWEQLAADAARLLRRGYTRLTLYLPEGLVRCARLLRAGDPREADALMHVARRWVRNALEHVPQQSRESFVNNVAVNRLLLGTDERALYTQPLR